MTGIIGIPEAVHQINKLQIAKVSCLKKQAGLLTCNIIYLLPVPCTVDP